MSLTKKERDDIKIFILWNIEKHPKDIVHFIQEKYNLSRTTILKYLYELGRENKIEIKGATRDRKYTLKALVDFQQKYEIQENLAEDKVWRNDIAPLFGIVRKNIFDICHYGFTEIFNNAIDHSEGSTISVVIGIWINYILISIKDDGVGIFNKIQKKYNLDDPSHAILELSKGKLTTEPASHTGEGIFFTSRMFDTFIISSGKYSFITQEADILFESEENEIGTDVLMKISQKSDRTTESVFSKFTSNSGDFGFEKTIVPVELARYGNENLISRSQAKRLMTRLEKFKTVLLDFNNIETVGRAFADEIFRVYVKSHPNIQVIPINESDAIQQLVKEIQTINSQ
jgi:anti-sigma regulatory factor (Ser/Thr protein kinase)